ncbi:MAG TPA: acyl-CoA dehydrogenase family protein, partial [Solirubrobacterales bacterium]|nr:acyl-CoA dehydrogenase family protein [Solirubrobacterales bacterium]
WVTMRRLLFEPEHEDFRASVRGFLSAEVVPEYGEWERRGIIPREAFLAAGAQGLLCPQVPEELGGPGVADLRFNAVLAEEIYLLGLSGYGSAITVQNDVCLPYFLHFADAEQQRRWLPGLVSGETIAAIAMTEPGTGSDLAAIATSAVRDGEEYVVDGSKTFITNGINADLVIVAARTERGEPRRGLTLLVVERGMEGFERGRNLEKIGMHSQDTAELYFDGVRVPAANRLGVEGDGFGQLTGNLAQERISIAVSAVAAARAALAAALDYTRERRAFGKPIADFQSARFALAEAWAEIAVTQSFVDGCVLALAAGQLDAVDAAVAKLRATELQGRVVDSCLQLHGGYGYMLEYPIARAYADARVSRIYGGANEIMKEIIGRSLVGGAR